MRRQAGPASAAPKKGTSVDDLLGKEGNEHSRSWASGKEEVVWNRKLFALNLYSHYQTEIQKQHFPDSTGLKNKETVQ